MGVVTLVFQPDEQIARVVAGSVALDPRIVGRCAVERRIAHILQVWLVLLSQDLAMPRACAGHRVPGEGSGADWSVGTWRHNTGSGDAAENTVCLIGESGSVEQRRHGLIGVTVSKD
jgi:hypothetical protein